MPIKNNKYPISDEMKSKIENRYTYRPLKPGQQDRYVKLRESVKRLAYDIVSLTPESIEQEQALFSLDESMMLANAAIARNE